MKKLSKQSNPKYLSPSSFFEDKLGNLTTQSSLTDILITTNTFDQIISKACTVTASGLSGIVSFFAGAFGGSTSILSHDSIPKKVHCFTKRGLHALSYRLQDIQNFNRTSKTMPLYSIDAESNKNFALSKIAQCTSAAPTFFPPFNRENILFMDGGVLQNDPTLPCIFDSLDRGYKRENLFVVSLGTGVTRKGNRSQDLLTTWFDTVQPDLETEFAIQDFLGHGAYHRLQYYFDDEPPSLDDHSKDTIRLLQNVGKQLVEENTDYIREICKILKPESS